MPGEGEEYPTGVIGPSFNIGMEFWGTLEKDLLLLLLQPLLDKPTGECMVGMGGEKGLPETLGRDTRPGLPRGLGDMNWEGLIPGLLMGELLRFRLLLFWGPACPIFKATLVPS